MKSILSVIKSDGRELKSERIAKSLFSLNAFQSAQTVFIFVSLDEESDTKKIIERSIIDEKLVAIPRICGNDLIFHPIHNEMKYTNHRLGIREPDSEEPVIDPEKLTTPFIIIVPGLAFDKKKRRLGRGGGFYDRFLKNLRQSAGLNFNAIGICFSEQIMDEVPTFEHDESVDVVVTDNAIIY